MRGDEMGGGAGEDNGIARRRQQPHGSRVSFTVMAGYFSRVFAIFHNSLVFPFLVHGMMVCVHYYVAFAYHTFGA